MDYEDRRLRCVSCGADFVWTAGEQRHFADRQLDHVPKRCPACSRHRGSGARQGDARVTYTVECSSCGRQTTVPFRPAEGRPVFCRGCYEQRRHEAAASRRPTG